MAELEEKLALPADVELVEVARRQDSIAYTREEEKRYTLICHPRIY